MKAAKIGIIGEYNFNRKTHPMLNQSLEWLKTNYNFTYEWVETKKIEIEGEEILKKYEGIWSASGSPFISLDGVYKAIEFARVNNIPHLGTCAGFQHTILEFAKNVIGIKNAQSEEYSSEAPELVINKLSCSIKGTEMELRIQDGSKAFKCYKKTHTKEEYFCNYGINAEFRDMLMKHNLMFSGIDNNDEVRIVEIPENDFFISTLFVPQAKSMKEKPHPLIEEFVKACIKML